MVSFPRYEKYKDSGIEWLGEIPEHWELTSGRTCFYEKEVKNKGNQVKTVLSLSYGNIVIKPEEKLHGLVPESFDTYQIVKPGDIIIRSTDLQNDKTSLRVGIVKDKGIITSAYLCLGTTERINPQYAYYLLHSYDLLKIYYGMGSGLRQNLSIKDFKYLPLTLPSLEEQKRIIEFLDRKTEEIDRAIAHKKRLIELLEEQKTILINQAVTKGLNPNAPMKDSGIEWLGEIPEHWNFTRLSHVTEKIGDGIHSTPRYVDSSNYYFINGNNLVEGDIVFFDNTRCVSEQEFNRYNLHLSLNTLLLSINGTIGNVAYYNGEPIILGKSAAYIKLKNNFYKNFFFYLLSSKAVEYFFLYEMTGTTIFNLSLKSLNNTFVLLPPLEEQKRIVQFLDNYTARVNSLKTKVKNQINILTELKQILIAEAVTGKIKI